MHRVMRREMRNRRSALTDAQQTHAALALIDVVSSLPQWHDAQHIALYAAFDGEIGALPLADYARSCAKQVYLPIVTAEKELLFGLWSDATTLGYNHYGIAEPQNNASHQPPFAMDIVFMPLVAWDASGNRLGMGGGYYDRALADIKNSVKVGLAHACQQVEYIERSEWDVAMDYVATDIELHECPASQ